MDEISILITQKNHREVIPVGDIKSITEEKIKETVPINLLIGGSPCTDTSCAKENRKGLEGNFTIFEFVSQNACFTNISCSIES